jgi:RHH-type proline utilization regulon transcriptional repressor/proline dehydrogenase/delta 1-pyrroline-5-carboxylate dehydrogenase
VIRLAVRQAMRIMGHQFVMGRTIKEALDRSPRKENARYRYSYDMLGEAALTQPMPSAITKPTSTRSTRSAHAAPR